MTHTVLIITSLGLFTLILLDRQAAPRTETIDTGHSFEDRAGMVARVITFWRVLAVLVFSFFAACGTEPERLPDPAPAGGANHGTCDHRSRPDVVLPCVIEFDSIGSLEGDLDGIAPREPIVRLSDGYLVTSTYQPGIVALWSPSGEVIRTIGNGEGDGPGEFSAALHFLEEDDLIGVVIRQPIIHFFDRSGRFVRTTRLERRAGFFSVVRAGEFFIGTGSRKPGAPIGLAWNADSAWAFGPAIAEADGPVLAAASDSAGVWAVSSLDYTLRRHALPSGAIIQEFVPEEYGGPLSGPEGSGNVYDIHADDEGFVWVLIAAPDPKAPKRPRPEVSTADEIRAQSDRYLDGVVEVFERSGRKLASHRYDGYSDSPVPLNGDFWYLVDREGLMPRIVIYSRRLSPRNDG